MSLWMTATDLVGRNARRRSGGDPSFREPLERGAWSHTNREPP
jgi:hypothetical protein